MALPKINSPTFELKLPSTGQSVKYRPFLVKEEKILLVAQQSGELKDILNAVVQIANNCIYDDIEVEKLPLFDIEFIFINLRSKSVSNVSEVMINDPDDGNQYKVEIDLDKVIIERPEKEISNKIDLGDGIGVVMRYPSITYMNSIGTAVNDADTAINIIMACVDKVYDTDNVYEASEYSKEELNEFIMSLSSKQFQNIQEFFNNQPKVTQKIKYKTKDGKEKELVLEGLNDFF